MGNKLKESTAIQTHINILQNIISRMGSNSANSKTWAITIISAIIVVLIDKSKTNIFYIAFVPLTLFFYLDCFYLGLEKYFRTQYNTFVSYIDSDKFDFKIVFTIQKPNIKENIKYTIFAIKSFSIFPFYGIIAVIIYIISTIS